MTRSPSFNWKRKLDDKQIAKFQDDYFTLVQDIIQAAPSTIPYVTRISNHIIADQLYKALKEARALIEHEKKIFAALKPAPADEKK